jgi:hypothetical protein
VVLSVLQQQVFQTLHSVPWAPSCVARAIRDLSFEVVAVCIGNQSKKGPVLVSSVTSHR